MKKVTLLEKLQKTLLQRYPEEYQVELVEGAKGKRLHVNSLTFYERDLNNLYLKTETRLSSKRRAFRRVLRFIREEVFLYEIFE